MSKYSLIAVTETNPDNTINGYWVQDKIGTLKQAKERAAATSKLNANQDIAIVQAVTETNPLLGFFTNLKRL